MTSESRPPPQWAGDVELGVQAWVGESPPTPAGKPRGRGRQRGRSSARSRSGEDRAATGAGKDVDQEALARSIVFNALSTQARSRKELADKLASRDVPDDVATALLDRFTEVGLIDDAAFAQQWVESRQRTRGLAPRALTQELRRKGIPDEDVKAALEQIDEQDQRVAARALVDKKLRSMHSVDRTTATRRLAGLLARKGYSSGLAFAVVREALGDIGHEHEA